jgi:hypothetical protein
MRIFIHDHKASLEHSVRHAVDILIKAGIYSAAGGGTVNDRAFILIDAVYVSGAIAALNQAGMQAIVE